MNMLLLVLCTFVALGMLSHRLQGFTYLIMGLVVFGYVFYAYGHG